MDWIDQVTDVVKTATDASQGWRSLLQLCKNERPSEMWDALPVPDPQDDARLARAWLVSQIGSSLAPKPVLGMYLGLDTLNMENGAGHNVELGATAQCDPFAPDGDWAWNCEWYGERHLIRGLVGFKNVYEQERWRDLYKFADYALFLGYSGLVLGDALAALVVRDPLLAIWGFHDGDLFRLGRRTPASFERLCAVL